MDAKKCTGSVLGNPPPGSEATMSPWHESGAAQGSEQLELVSLKEVFTKPPASVVSWFPGALKNTLKFGDAFCRLKTITTPAIPFPSSSTARAWTQIESLQFPIVSPSMQPAMTVVWLLLRA